MIMTLEELTLLTLDPNYNPFAKLTLEAFELKVDINVEKEMLVHLKGGEFEASYFLFDGQKMIQEKPLMGSLNIDTVLHTVEAENAMNEAFKQIILFGNKEKEKKKLSKRPPGVVLNLLVKEGANNNKIIRLDLDNLKAYLALAVYDGLLDFVFTDENDGNS